MYVSNVEMSQYSFSVYFQISLIEDLLFIYYNHYVESVLQ